jgi:hypothetical protein
MSIEDTSVVDFIGHNDNVVTLTVTDHLEWGNDEHLLLLQEKLNTYLAFIESDELLSAYPQSENKKKHISVVCKFPPDEQAETLFSNCRVIIENAGFSFSYEVIDT